MQIGQSRRSRARASDPADGTEEGSLQSPELWYSLPRFSNGICAADRQQNRELLPCQLNSLLSMYLRSLISTTNRATLNRVPPQERKSRIDHEAVWIPLRSSSTYP